MRVLVDLLHFYQLLVLCLVSDGVDLVGLDAVALVVSDLGWASFLDTDWTGLATCLAAAAEEFVA